MDLLPDLRGLFVVVTVAALAPVLAALVPGRRLPQVVLLILGGVLIGPEVLGWAAPDEVGLIADVGLAFVFLLAGFEIDLTTLVAGPGRLAATAWSTSLVVALAVVTVLDLTGYVTAFVPVALALTTTALGTLIPILREQGLLGTAFGRHFLANGAVGELFPIVAIAMFLGVHSELAAILSLVVIGAAAVVLALLPRLRVGRHLTRLVSDVADATGQANLRWTMVLLLALVVLAGEFGLDVVLGAFLAGAVLRHWAPPGSHALEAKLDAVGYGFFIPVFFVSSGMGIDIDSIRESPGRLFVFLALLLAVRGLPVLLVYRRALPSRSRWALMLCTATTLPLIVALTQIGLETGIMLPENAAALVGAGVLSVLLFPLVGTHLAATDAADVPAGSVAADQGS